MRLWHKDLIPVLPNQQLLGQWRECCAIARNIAVKGTPNHILVNKIMDYPMGHFWKYGFLVFSEMKRRGYKCNFDNFEKWIEKPYALITPEYNELFEGWHSVSYLRQCFFNLQEKYDCGGISDIEFGPVIKLCKEREKQYLNNLFGINNYQYGINTDTAAGS